MQILNQEWQMHIFTLQNILLIILKYFQKVKIWLIKFCNFYQSNQIVTNNRYSCIN